MTIQSASPFYLISNWKMFGTRAEVSSFIRGVGSFIKENTGSSKSIKTIVCPAYTALDAARTTIKELGISDELMALGSQNSSRYFEGSYTGEVSVAMLQDLNVEYTILGHSERRQFLKEDCDIVRQKAISAQKGGIKPIICIGENIEDKKAGLTEEILRDQICNSLPRGFSGIVSYEPTWAIGTGEVPSKEELKNISSFINLLFEEELSSDIKPQLLYGGSVNQKTITNTLDIPGISGLLMGRAGRDENEFKKIWQLTNAALNNK